MTPEAGAPSPRPPGDATGGKKLNIPSPVSLARNFKNLPRRSRARSRAGGKMLQLGPGHNGAFHARPRAQQPNAAHPLPPPSPKWRRSRPALRKWGGRRSPLSIRGRPRHFLFGKVRRSGRGGRAGSGKDPRRLLRGTCAEGRDVRGHVGRPELVAAAGREVGPGAPCSEGDFFKR